MHGWSGEKGLGRGLRERLGHKPRHVGGMIISFEAVDIATLSSSSIRSFIRGRIGSNSPDSRGTIQQENTA